jgi:formate dehydrogenase major subunit
LAASFGRGVMTNHWIDLRYADVVLVIGSNAAENHPLSFKWITDAIESRGAKLISVDPRFTRTSARAHLYAPLRTGTDIAFIGGMIRHVLDHALYQKEYVEKYTNAAFLIDPKFEFSEGLFSGYDAAGRKYDKATWAYQLDQNKVPKRDPELKDPQCVLQLLRRHYEKYDLETVSRVCGTPVETLKAVYDQFAATGKPDKAGTILYAMGATQHTIGSQIVRSYAVVQLLLGNIGVAGGGINALRGESNVQGSTDQGLLFHILTGYLNAPKDGENTVDEYIKKYYEGKNVDPQSLAWWSNARKYLVSLLKEYWGDEAKPDNDFRFGWLPRVGGNYSHISLFEDMAKGGIKGAFFFGQNPAVGGPNTLFERDALAKLDWMVAVDLWETETSVFWKRDGVNPADVRTEVFRLPASASVEKQGSITNSGRWAQWRWKGGDAPGEARDDLWIVHAVQKEVRGLYKAKGGKFAAPILQLNWPYEDKHGHPDPELVAKAMNGYNIAANKQVKNFTELAADGSTACGNWVYAGAYTADGNIMAKRDNKDTHLSMYHNWSFAWPMNRRIVYNRASVDPSGQPWDPTRAVIAWKDGKWVGDVPDGGMPPMNEQVKAGKPALPFIMRNEGVGCLFGVLEEGPFPSHYEPMESPVGNLLYPQRPTNPVAFIYAGKSGEFGKPDQYPIVGTIYRVSEHWQAGAMTRNLPWLNELFPELFVELGEDLAKEKGIANGDLVKIWNNRGAVVAKACVTKRFQALKVDGKLVHTVGLPWHWGYCGLCSGDSANILTPHVGDANTRIPEFKSFLVDIKKA